MMNVISHLAPWAGDLARPGKTKIDWILLAAIVPLLAAGLVTMHSFSGEDHFFSRQLLWIGLGLVVFFSASLVDFRFLRRTGVVTVLYSVMCVLLLFLLLVGNEIRGVQSWFSLGAFTFQPSDPAKLILIVLLAKYFTRRHVEIAHIRHVIVSGLYALVLFLFVMFQPDFGSAIIIFLIWFGMVLVSGISKRHLAIVLSTAVLVFAVLWFFGFEDYQRDRILTFLHPYTDLAGSGYNAYQSTVAVGSGEWLGKGIGFGTQSRLKFLPEYETDFIFSAYAEEWGFIGVVLLVGMYGVVIARVLQNATQGISNFEILFGVGIAVYLMSHFVIHVGMNMGLLPVTGLVLPFMSYGGSHIVSEFLGLGILMGMRRYRRVVHRESVQNEFLGY